MTVDARTPATYTWTPRVTVQLMVLAAAAFVYVTAEIVPVGALPAIAADLRVSKPGRCAGRRRGGKMARRPSGTPTYL